MNSDKLLHIFSLVLEILGGFFLAVEAIKLKRIKRWRAICGKRPLRLLTPKFSISKKATAQQVATRKAQVEQQIFLALMLLGCLIIFITAVATAGSLEAVWADLNSQLPKTPIGKVFFWFLMIIFYSFSGMMVGFVLYKTVRFPFRTLVGCLLWIEKHTATGCIGVIGFVLFVIAAIVRTIATWPSR